MKYCTFPIFANGLYRSPYGSVRYYFSKENGQMKAKRQRTVEPVFGFLKEFMGLRKVNTIGITQANKCTPQAAIVYNLKAGRQEYLKFTKKPWSAGQGYFPGQFWSLNAS